MGDYYSGAEVSSMGSSRRSQRRRIAPKGAKLFKEDTAEVSKKRPSSFARPPKQRKANNQGWMNSKKDSGESLNLSDGSSKSYKEVATPMASKPVNVIPRPTPQDRTP